MSNDDHDLRPSDRGSSALAPLGTPTRWARDMALVGGVSGFAAPFAVLGQHTELAIFSPVAGVLGGLTGAALGFVLPRILAGPLAKRRVASLLLGGVLAGGLWGALVGTLASVIALGSGFLLVSAVLAGIGGAVQFGWVWLPYMMRSARRQRTWPVLLGACLLAPLLGHIALWLPRLL